MEALDKQHLEWIYQRLIHVHKENENYDYMIKFRSILGPDPSSPTPSFEYEMFFKSEPTDFCKIDGWYPIATGRIKNPERIEEYIKKGLLRKIRQERNPPSVFTNTQKTKT